MSSSSSCKGIEDIASTTTLIKTEDLVFALQMKMIVIHHSQLQWCPVTLNNERAWCMTSLWCISDCFLLLICGDMPGKPWAMLVECTGLSRLSE